MCPDLLDRDVVSNRIRAAGVSFFVKRHHVDTVSLAQHSELNSMSTPSLTTIALECAGCAVHRPNLTVIAIC